jgi:hypothetical protein
MNWSHRPRVLMDTGVAEIAAIVAAVAGASATAVQQENQRKARSQANFAQANANARSREAQRQASLAQERQIAGQFADQRARRISELRRIEGRTIALAAASGGTQGTPQAFLGQLVEDARLDLATLSENTGSALQSSGSRLNANLIALTDRPTPVPGFDALGVAAAATTTGVQAYSFTRDINLGGSSDNAPATLSGMPPAEPIA